MKEKRLQSIESPFKFLVPSGINKGDQILLSGTPGTGKTLLALQFLAEGAVLGEKGVFVSFESDEDYLIQQAAGIGLNLSDLIREGKIKIIKPDPSDIYLALDEIKESVKQLSALRLCLDSVSIMSVYSASYRNLPEDLVEFMQKVSHHPPIAFGDNIQKQMIYYLLKKIRSLGATTLLISELPKNSEWYSRDTISEFVSDGIILLDQQLLGEENVVRTIAIVKLRGSAYRQGVFEFNFEHGKGVVVKVNH